MFSLVPEIVPVGTPSMWPQTAKVQLQVLRDIILYGIYLINVTLVFFSSHDIYFNYCYSNYNNTSITCFKTIIYTSVDKTFGNTLV